MALQKQALDSRNLIPPKEAEARAIDKPRPRRGAKRHPGPANADRLRAHRRLQAAARRRLPRPARPGGRGGARRRPGRTTTSPSRWPPSRTPDLDQLQRPRRHARQARRALGLRGQALAAPPRSAARSTPPTAQSRRPPPPSISVPDPDQAAAPVPPPLPPLLQHRLATWSDGQARAAFELYEAAGHPGRRRSASRSPSPTPPPSTSPARSPGR